MIPCLTLCMSRSGDRFVMINYALNPQFGYAEEYGQLVRFTFQEMEREGLKTVIRSLEEYSKRRRTEKSELESLTKEEQQDFDRQHKHVAVSLQKGQELWLGPMHFGKKGGLESVGPQERVVVKLPTTQDSFFKALLEAFRVAE